MIDQQHILALLFAFCGGIAREVNAWLRGQDKIDIIRMLAHGLVSGFCGYMVFLVVEEIYPTLAAPSAGISGWLGAESFKIIVSFIKKRDD